MVWQVIKNRILQWSKRIILYGLYGTLVFFAVALSILQIPAVQKSLLEQITGRFSEASGFTIEYERFYLLWYDRLEITNLKITDSQKNTMIEAGRLFVNFEISDLFQRNTIYLDAVSLQEGGVNLVTIPISDTTKDLNIDVFIAEVGRQLSSGK